MKIAGKLKIKTLCLASLLILLSFFLLQSDKTSVVAETNSWISANPGLTVGRDATSEDIKTPRTCVTSPWQYYSYTDKDNKPSKNPRLLSVDICGISGVGGGYVEAGYAYKIKGSAGVIGIPKSSKVIVVRGIQNGLSFAIEDSLSSIGTFTAANSSNPLEGTYEVTSPSNVFKNDQNQTIPFRYNSFNFSPNGKYIVAEVPFVGFVRINVDTEELLLFSTQTYNYGQGYDPTPQMGISNDGKTVIVSNFEGGPLNIYDLNGCTVKQIKAYNNVATGCKNPKDIRPTAKSQFTNFWGLSGIRFAENDKSIYGIMTDYNPASKVRISKKVILNTAGYVPESTSYIAMGDSFASGEGDMDGNSWYEEGTDTDVNKCHQSKRSYPYLLSQFLDNKEFHSVACSGAETDNIEKKIQYPKTNSNIAGSKVQIKSFEGQKPSFVTISIGGNDVDFLQKLSACVTNDYKALVPDTCKYADNPTVRAGVAREIADQYKILKETYETLKDKTDGETKIYVMGYPQFVRGEDGNCGNNVHLNDQEREFVHHSVKYMNQVIRSAATDAGVYYLDIEDTLQTRNLCSGVPDSQMVVNGVTFGDDKGVWVSGYSGGKVIVQERLGLGNESFHPNQNAQPLIRDRILQITNNDPASFVTCPAQPDHAVCDAKKGKIPEPTTSYFGVEVTDYIKSKNAESTQVFPLVMKQKQMIAADSQQESTNIILDGLKPNSAIKLEAQSNPVDLGTFYADSTGNLAITIDIKNKLSPGPHEIHAYTKNIAGESQEYYQHIFITGAEGDINGNNTSDDQEKCGFVPDSGIDYDKDGVDDACDGFISEPPQISSAQQTSTVGSRLSDTRGDEFLQFSADISNVAGLSFATSLTSTITDQGINLLFNDPQASSNLINNFNNGSSTHNKTHKIEVQKNNYILVLIPIVIIIVTAIKIAKARVI